MSTPIWVGTHQGVPPASIFGCTYGLGSPLVIDALTGAAYYYKPGVGVTPVSGGGGATWATIELDFGAGWSEVGDFIVTNAAITPISTLLFSISGADTTVGNDAETHGAVEFSTTYTPGAGTAAVRVEIAQGMVTGKLKIRYAIN